MNADEKTGKDIGRREFLARMKNIVAPTALAGALLGTAAGSKIAQDVAKEKIDAELPEGRMVENANEEAKRQLGDLNQHEPSKVAAEYKFAHRGEELNKERLIEEEAKKYKTATMGVGAVVGAAAIGGATAFITEAECSPVAGKPACQEIG